MNVERAVKVGIVLGSDSDLDVMLEAVKAGLGVTFLLCFAADAEPTLRRLEPPRPELALGLWLLTHRDLRRAARVRAFLDFMAKAIARKRAALECQTPGGSAALRRAAVGP